MRSLFFLSALALLLTGSFDLVRADEGTVSPAVQATIDKIKEWDGQCTLTPANTIRTITFADGSELDDEAFDLFAGQTDLESLQIANNREINAALTKLTGLKKLKTLWLSNCALSDASVKVIVEAFPNLVNLDISRNARLTDAATKEIAKLTQLEVLNLLFCNFSEFGMMNIAALPKLRALDIRANMQIGDSGMRTLAKLPALRSLKHRGPVADEGIRALAEVKTLDNFEIQDFRITGQSGQYIRQMEKLTGLIIFRCENFDSSGILALKGLKLNRLTLRGLPADDASMEVFSGLTTLKRLYLHELFSVTDAGILPLASLKDLELLDIWEMPITDKALPTIVQLPALKTLWLRSTGITDAGLELLLTMPQLETVRLADNGKVTPGMIQKLKDAGKFKVE